MTHREHDHNSSIARRLLGRLLGLPLGTSVLEPDSSEYKAIKEALDAAEARGEQRGREAQGEPWWLVVTPDGKPCAAYPRRVMAEAYLSNWRSSPAIEEVRLIRARAEKGE